MAFSLQACLDITCVSAANRGQESGSDALELKLCNAMQLLRVEAKTFGALNHSALNH